MPSLSSQAHHATSTQGFHPSLGGDEDEDGFVFDMEQWVSGKSSSGYMGVQATGKRFTVQMHFPQVGTQSLGSYHDLRQAVRTYAKEYVKIHGKAPEPRYDY